MKFYKSYGACLLMAIQLVGCVEPYDPPLDDDDVNYLVVDGFLNATEHTATVRLTRTLPVKSEEAVPFETGAAVRVEDDHGSVYALTEIEPGKYSGDMGQVSTDRQYRLLVHTRDNREYASDFITIMESPPIDSISYAVEDGGIQFFVNTHDPSGKSKHYRWKYTETFEYHSNFYSAFMFSPQGGIAMRRPEQAINICWKTNVATEIMVGSTKHLKESVISRYPISFIPYGSLKLTVKYSLLVQQQALTEQAYDYWLNLEKSTENLGGLFDPLPSEVTGNIRSMTHPDEKVIGFFSGSTLHETRRYLRRNQLPEELWRLFRNNNYCTLDTIMLADLPTASTGTLLVDAIYSMGGGIIGYTISMPHCVDCTTFGGVTAKPPFWE
ncbi:MAG: DUF4249 domain-containing protein [Chryseosolibacter sp.]